MKDPFQPWPAHTHKRIYTVGKPSGRVSLARLHKDREGDEEQIGRETER